MNMYEYLQNMTVDELKIWIPSLVSIITLFVNMGFYILGQPRLGYKYKRKEQLASICEEMFAYLSEIVSYDDFLGVPTQIRNYSLKIHLCFKSGTAKEEISTRLEKIYQMCKKRKTIIDQNDIKNWNDKFRIECRELRKSLGKYCGGL